MDRASATAGVLFPQGGALVHAGAWISGSEEGSSEEEGSSDEEDDSNDEGALEAAVQQASYATTGLMQQLFGPAFATNAASRDARMAARHGTAGSIPVPQGPSLDGEQEAQQYM